MSGIHAPCTWSRTSCSEDRDTAHQGDHRGSQTSLVDDTAKGSKRDSQIVGSKSIRKVEETPKTNWRRTRRYSGTDDLMRWEAATDSDA